MTSIYQTGTENMRDVTKWLAALVPTAAVIGAVGLLAPRLLGSADHLGNTVRMDDYRAILVGTILLLVGTMGTVGTGASVLATQPAGLSDLLTDEHRLSKAFEVGVGVPYFIDSESFVAALRDLQLALKSNGSLADGVAERTAAAVDDLRAWALHRATSRRFVIFLAAFGVGVIMMLVGFLVASSNPSQNGVVIEHPTDVRVEVSKAGAASLLRETGCKDAARSTVLAIGGTWLAPILTLDGPGCTFGATWRPTHAAAVLFLPK